MSKIFKLFSSLAYMLILLGSAAWASDVPRAGTTELTFVSEGHRMSGFVYQAAGEGPHPTVLLLHGYPGNEKNLDVAQSLRARGWNVVFFHYRGAWGSEGEFSFLNAEQDVQAVLAYLSNPQNAQTLRIDRDRISIVGHSMGGHMAIAGILDNASVRCSVAYDGANLGAAGVGFVNDPNTSIPWKEYGDTLFMLQGWSGAKAVEETENYAVELDLIRRAEKIKGRPVLLIAADTEVIPIDLHIKPLLKALRETGNQKVHYKLIKDDHSFNSTRGALIEATYGFLSSNCAG